MKTINFAIDLGTTNSLIAKYQEGSVKIYNNPLGLKQTLPSCIAFRGNRVVIGDKALDYLEKDAKNICMLFKRKMGTQDVYAVPSKNAEYNPIELSSMILKELKNFLLDDSSPDAVVITIPASFNTVQSNATKKAGYLAGFREVVLLQEPIAACLAFANTLKLDIKTQQYWLVYDFGGGTFDVALIDVNDRELKILDNQGDNYLGGADFDYLIAEHLIVPEIEGVLGARGIWKDIKSKSSKNKGVYFEILRLAEEAKKELSIYQETEIEVDLIIDGADVYQQIVITRKSFEALISTTIDDTLVFVKNLITDNKLLNSQIAQIILIGGTSYIPLIRERLREAIGVKVNTEINPTSAVVEGAAFYASSRPITIGGTSNMVSSGKDANKNSKGSESAIETKVYYEQNTRDAEEIIAVHCTDLSVCHYRIIRKDGGYDTGVKAFENNVFQEFVPLLKSRLNQFKIQLLDKDVTTLKLIDNVNISHGSYNIQGQPLPNDICMEIDDLDSSTTRLEKIFGKGSILPLRKKIYKTASKTILKQSKASIIINIIEGSSKGLPSSGLSIGYIEVAGNQLEEDLIKGTDIEIDLEITESRDVKINVFLQACEQEFENVFSPTERAISVRKITMEINAVRSEVETLITEANAEENFEYSQKLEHIRKGLIDCQIAASLIEDDEVSDKKFQLDDRKRKLVQNFDDITRNKKIAIELDRYFATKDTLEYHLNKAENKGFISKYSQILSNEKEVINSGNKYLIRSKIHEMDELFDAIIQSSDENFISYFLSLKFSSDYKDQEKATGLIKQGEKAIEKKDYKSLRYIVYALFALLPDYKKEKQKGFKDESRTGLS